MTYSISLTRWMPALMLAALFAAGAGSARGQMTADLIHDMALLEQSIVSTVAAIDSGDGNAARVAMETLFQDWRRFRRMNYEGAPSDPQFVPDMDIVEARLFAASQEIDESNYAGARAELEVAHTILRVVSDRQQSAS